MIRHVQIRLKIPLEPRRNFDVITKGLDKTANNFSLLDLDRLLKSGKLQKNVDGIEMEFELFD